MGRRFVTWFLVAVFLGAIPSFSEERNEDVLATLDKDSLPQLNEMIRQAKKQGTGKSSWTKYAIPYLSDVTTFGEIGIGGANEVLAVNSGATGYAFKKDYIKTSESITSKSAGTAASTTTFLTKVTTDGDAGLDNVTLADGTANQIKIIYCGVEGNAGDTWKVTPAHFAGGTNITFAGAGEGCALVFDGTNWSIFANNGGTVA